MSKQLQPPPSKWDEETIAHKLDIAIRSMKEPIDRDELPQYRATIRVMRKAAMHLQASASLLKALEFYAWPGAYVSIEGGKCRVLEDRGITAKQALKAATGEA